MVSASRARTPYSNYTAFKSHGRRVSRDDLRALDMSVVDLEEDQTLQDLVLSVHHAINHVMGHTGVVKIVENHLGKAYLRRVGVIQVAASPAPPGAPGIPGLPAAKGPRGGKSGNPAKRGR